MMDPLQSFRRPRPGRPVSLSLAVLAVGAILTTACDVGSSTPDSELGPSPGGAAAGQSTGASGGGASALGGSGGTGGQNDAGASQFKLLYRDDFDALDTARWQLMTHSWDGNSALFAEEPVKVADGMLTLSLLPAPAGTVDSNNVAKAYLGAEVRSVDTLTYGRVSARIRFAKGPAVVSSLVTIYTPWPADDWNELDIECLGASPSRVQLNTMVYTGAPPTPPVTTSVKPTQEPYKPQLGFDPTEDFHVYSMEWTPAAVTFTVDEQVVYTWTKHIDRMKLPQNVLLTIWASSSASWAGAPDATTTEAKAIYDWVELYQYVP
jgi:endo-1,3-1,4-beta-glycanase ExoK